jgi:N-ethylmaleimide reductase
MLRGHRLSYLHVVEGDMMTGQRALDYRQLKRRFEGPYMANNGYDFERASAALREGAADLVSFGKLFLANPDLPERFALGAPLNAPDPDTFYGGDERGYTDYPSL